MKLSDIKTEVFAGLGLIGLVVSAAVLGSDVIRNSEKVPTLEEITRQNHERLRIIEVQRKQDIEFQREQIQLLKDLINATRGDHE